jgi:hypothetical protein
MTQVTQGALTMVGLNTDKPTVFWNGGIVPGVTAIRVEWEDDEQRVRLTVAGFDPIHTSLQNAGITVKQERRHE